MKELDLSTGALIRPDLENYEIISCCEKQNKFDILFQSKMGLKIVFKYIESTSCCCKGLKIKFLHISFPAEIIADLCKIFLKGEKSCCVGCLCFCRTVINFKLEKGQKHIRGIREPFTLCGKDYEIYDDSGNLIYQVIDSKIIKDNEEKGFIKKENMQFGINNHKVVETYKINFSFRCYT